MKKRSTKKAYSVPRVETLTVRQLQESVGPAQGFSSGAPAALAPTKKTHGHGRGHGRGRGHRG